MKKLIFLVLLLPVFVAGQVPLSQENNAFTHQIHEELICFTDRNLYLAGDGIWFSVFIGMNGEISTDRISDVLYVELINQEDKALASAKYPIQGINCSGNFKIPAQIASGAYFLRLYTRYQRNFHAASFGHVPVTIVNTGVTLPSSKGKSLTALDNAELKIKGVQLSKPVYDSREQAVIEVNTGDYFAGWLCVSVARKGTMMKNSYYASGVREIQLADDSVFYIPDIRGISISGFVRNKSGSGALVGIPVYLSAFGENRLFHITETGPEGSFLFSLQDMYGLSDVFVTIDPGMQNQNQLLINTGFSNQFAGLPEHGFSIDSSYLDLLTALQVDFEARQAFVREFMFRDHDAILNLPGTFDVSVKLDDYIELSSFEEVIYEIVPPVFVKNENGVKRLSVANYQTKHVSEAGLVLLDNVPVFNINELLKIPPVNIDRIDVINRPYYLGDYMLESIISISTKTGDFGGYQFPDQSVFLEYQAFENPGQFPAPDYSSEDAKYSPLPDFRTTLFWEPALPVEKPRSEISFFTSDARGKYDVVVFAVSADGKVSVGKSTLEVR